MSNIPAISSPQYGTSRSSAMASEVARLVLPAPTGPAMPTRSVLDRALDAIAPLKALAHALAEAVEGRSSVLPLPTVLKELGECAPDRSRRARALGHDLGRCPHRVGLVGNSPSSFCQNVMMYTLTTSASSVFSEPCSTPRPDLKALLSPAASEARLAVLCALVARVLDTSKLGTSCSPASRAPVLDSHAHTRTYCRGLRTQPRVGVAPRCCCCCCGC